MLHRTCPFLTIYLFIYLFIYFIYLSINLSINLSIYLSIFRDDFIKHFNSINAIYPPVGMDNLHYKVVEHDACLGTCRGCVWGCLKYWLCCKGIQYLCFTKSSEEVMYKMQHSSDEDTGLSWLV